MRHISTEIVGDNLKGEIAPFSFPLPSGGLEIRGASPFGVHSTSCGQGCTTLRWE